MSNNDERVQRYIEALRTVPGAYARDADYARAVMFVADAELAERCIPIANLVHELGIARQEVQRARAECWQEGFDRAEYMAHCWGHTDHWGEEDPYPTNPYGAALDGDA